MDVNTMVIFENVSSNDFTGYWNSKPYLIKAGETKKMPFYLAKHLAKHLATKELGAEIIDTDDAKVSFIKSCINQLDVPRIVEDETEMLVETMNDEPLQEEEEFEELKEKTNEDIKKTSKKPRAKTSSTGSKGSK